MHPQELRKLAQTGNAPAIAALIGFGLRPLGIQAAVARDGERLRIELRANWAIPQPPVIRILQRGLRRIAPQGIRKVEVQARPGTADEWSHAWELRPADGSPDTPGESPIPHPGLLPSHARSGPEIGPSPPGRGVGVRATALAASLQRRPRLTLTATIGLLACLGAGWLLIPNETPETPTAAIQGPRIVGAIERPPPMPAIPTPKGLAPGHIRIKAVGDIVPGTDYPAPRLMAGREAEAFDTIRGMMADADLVFGNLETTLTAHPSSGKNISQPNVYAFRTPPAYAEWLRYAGFDLLSVANNHSFDFQAQGFADTLHHLQQAGIQGVGDRGKPAIHTVRGQRIAFVGFSYLSHTDSIHDTKAVAELIERARSQADLVVVSVHAGAEGSGAIHLRDAEEHYLGERRGNLVAFAHTAIDQGADLVLGHGPHVPRAMELYRGRLIAYSLGNFMGYRTLSTAGAGGVSLVLEVELDREGAFRGGRIHPVRLDGAGIPFADPRGEVVKLVRELTLADLPKSGVAVGESGALNSGREEDGVLAAREARGDGGGPMNEALSQAADATTERKIVR